MGIDVPRPSTRPRWIDADEAMLKLLAIRSVAWPIGALHHTLLSYEESPFVMTGFCPSG